MPTQLLSVVLDPTHYRAYLHANLDFYQRPSERVSDILSTKWVGKPSQDCTSEEMLDNPITLSLLFLMLLGDGDVVAGLCSLLWLFVPIGGRHTHSTPHARWSSGRTSPSTKRTTNRRMSKPQMSKPQTSKPQTSKPQMSKPQKSKPQKMTRQR